jgi:hypothetical protein
MLYQLSYAPTLAHCTDRGERLFRGGEPLNFERDLANGPFEPRGSRGELADRSLRTGRRKKLLSLVRLDQLVDTLAQVPI